jgi:hypothetical protein
MRALALALALAIACGRIDFAAIDAAMSSEVDADPDAQASGCWSAWFARTVELVGLRRVDEVLGASAGDPSLAEDDLRLYVWGSGPDLYTATRASRAAAWTAVTPVAELNSPSIEHRVSLSADGLDAVFNSDRGGNFDLWAATRASVTVPFEPPTATNLAGLADDYDPELSSDGLRLYFARTEGVRRIVVATRPARDQPFADPVVLTELGEPTHDPSLSPDERVIVYSRTVGADRSVHYATRARMDDPFESPTLIPIPSSIAGTRMFDPEVSQDGCELLFRATDGAADWLFVAAIQ